MNSLQRSKKIINAAGSFWYNICDSFDREIWAIILKQSTAEARLQCRSQHLSRNNLIQYLITHSEQNSI